MQVRKDIKIFVGNELSNVKKCPTTVVSNNPCFKWILPDDLKNKQTRFCLQLKSKTSHVLSSGEKDYSFYQSGDIESRDNFFEINFGTTGLLYQSWVGAVAIRLFISIKTKEELENVKIPYEYVSDEFYISDTEWKDDQFNILDDSRYFVFDDNSEKLKIQDVICKWKNSYDLNNDKLVYYAEISKSPLFNKETLYFEIKDSEKTYSKLETSLEHNTSYFFRIKSFDGFDYSDWSPIHGFQLTSNEKPIVEILSHENLGFGNIKINFKVFDSKQNKITLKLLYSGGSKSTNKSVPTLLEPLHFFIITEENEGLGSLIWKSLYNETNDADDFFLYIVANDGFENSEEFVYGPFSIHNKNIFRYKTSGGSYFLTFPVCGKTDFVSKQQLQDYNYSIPVLSRNGIIKNYIYLGYDNMDVPFENITIYGMLFAENANTFCVKTPTTVYRNIYHHGKYMLYDYDIPSRVDKDGVINIDKKDGKVDKDPYVIAPEFNPTLNVDKKGVNKSIVYSSNKKLEDKDGKPLPLPNGEWYSETEEKNGLVNYIQTWGNELKANYGFGELVFEDDNLAPQYTLDPYDLNENGYPKPISYSTFDNIGKNTIIYIKKYRIENGFKGNPKNFIVKNNGKKYEREYFAVRGEAPKIIYDNGIPYWSYNGELINKYNPEDISEEVANELPSDFPEDAIYLPQYIWKKKIKYAHIAVPYYVISTEAIYRPGDHKNGVVGKGEPIVVESYNKTATKKENKLNYSIPSNGKIKIPFRDNSYIGQGSAKSGGMYLSQDRNLYVKHDGKIKTFIYNNDTIDSFLERNYNSIIEFKKDIVTIYTDVNFEALKDIMEERSNSNKHVFPYYAYWHKYKKECVCNAKNEEDCICTTKEPETKYFILNSSKEFDVYSILQNNAKKYIEINLKEKLYYSFNRETPYLIPQDYDIPVFGINMKEQRYLTDKRNKGKSYEKFDFLDYICDGEFLENETMYYAGINGWSENNIVDDYNRAIKFICNIKLADKLKELKIIYLQYFWDSYNQIHWTGNLSVQTYIRIEYTKLAEGKELGWNDLKFESSIYNEKFDMWLIKPQTYASLIDNFNYKQFDDEFQYRMRISGVDLSDDLVNVIGPVIATPDFTIDDDAINPFVIESMNFNPWTKQLEIKFRVDDLQGDLYDITSMKFTTDEKVWKEINLGDIVGKIDKLQSNTLKNRESENIITHTINWSLSSYVTKSSSIRIQIYGTLSKYNTEFDYPFFSWVCWDNQRVKLAEDEENYILGQWIKYEKVTDKNGNLSWKELENPIRQSNGELENTVNSINEIQSKYEESDKSLSYDEWLQKNYDGGISYASRLQVLQSTQKDLQDRLNKAQRMRFAGEMFTRKQLIKQGFYCNGFVNNNIENDPFEYKVLNLPIKGHYSTIDWGKEKEDVSSINGDFKSLTDNIDNIELLKENGFEIKTSLPTGIIVDDKTSPSIVEVVNNNSTNYLHINNSNEEQQELKTKFYMNLDKLYAEGNYNIYFDSYTSNQELNNSIKVSLERYNNDDGIFQESNIGTLEDIKLQTNKTTFDYLEENKNLTNRLKFSRIVFECTGDVYISNIGINVKENKTKTVEEEIGTLLSDNEIEEDEKYTVCYRVQLDFQDNFSSQRFGVPLRDIIYTNISSTGELNYNKDEKARIKGGSVRGGVFLVNKDVTNATNKEVTTAIQEIVEEGKKIETESIITEEGNNIGITFNPNNDKRKYGNLTIPKSDLPGEWKDKYINESFNSVNDESKFTNNMFNGNYYWRLAPYNIVECKYEEISHSEIVAINKGKNSVSIELKCVSNEQIEELFFNGNFWYCKELLNEPMWQFDWKENDSNVVFPTDMPRKENGAVIMGQNSIIHVPYSTDRTKPFVIKDNDEFNYYMFYSKPSALKQNVIIQSTGKSWNRFGELSQLFPEYISDSLSKEKIDELNIVSMFSPCALFMSLNNNSLYRQKILYVWSTVQTKENSMKTVLFVSDIGKVDFNKPIFCKGLDNVYHPCSIQIEETIYMIGCKNHSSKSCLFLYSSIDGINWQEENNGEPILIPENNISSPCISKEENGYKIYLTEWENTKSKIVSYETLDLIELNNKTDELISFETPTEKSLIYYKNPRNACVIDDMYMGNKIKRIYYNVDVEEVKDGITTTNTNVIKTMFLETGKWIKGTKESWGDTELQSSLFGKNSTIGLNIDDAINVISVRLDIELSDIYKKMTKECILQSDWIDKNNCEEYNAIISPFKDFTYNSLLKDKKYTGE